MYLVYQNLRGNSVKHRLHVGNTTARINKINGCIDGQSERSIPLPVSIYYMMQILKAKELIIQHNAIWVRSGLNPSCKDNQSAQMKSKRCREEQQAEQGEDSGGPQVRSGQLSGTRRQDGPGELGESEGSKGLRGQGAEGERSHGEL